jgi:hypothetical protein
MNKFNQSLLAALILTSSVSAFAIGKEDGSDVPACKGVTDICMAAPVTATDSKTGKVMNGYISGEHKRDGHGLWADCVEKLAKSQPVQGVTGVSAESAKACLVAQRAAHPERRKTVTK